jgi:dTMP kinase
LAYQGYGRGLGVAAVRELNARAVEEGRPDLTFYLRLSSEERARRARAADAPLDRIERMGSEFMQRVEEGFEELAVSEPDRIKVLDAGRSPNELAGMVEKEILDLPEIREQVESYVQRYPRQ